VDKMMGFVKISYVIEQQKAGKKPDAGLLPRTMAFANLLPGGLRPGSVLVQ
jgi:hypothetical protein